MEKKANNKCKYFIVAYIVILAVCCLCVLLVPSIYERICKTRTNDELSQQITREILNANINIVTKSAIKSENVEQYTYNLGASGVIIDKRDNVYYALTAYHIVKNSEDCDYYIISYSSPRYDEYSKQFDNYCPLSEYYEQFPVADIVYCDEKYDLAIISFESKDILNLLSVAQKAPGYKEPIATIGNPEGEKFIQTYGNITSEKTVRFDTNDGAEANMVLRHNAYEAPGSSGSVVLNDKMEVIGINIGGATDFLGRFRYGVMIPSDMIQEFINDWKSNEIK